MNENKKKLSLGAQFERVRLTQTNLGSQPLVRLEPSTVMVPYETVNLETHGLEFDRLFSGSTVSSPTKLPSKRYGKGSKYTAPKPKRRK